VRLKRALYLWPSVHGIVETSQKTSGVFRQFHQSLTIDKLTVYLSRINAKYHGDRD